MNAVPAELIIRIRKTTDGGAALTLERQDGTRTWHRQQGAQGRFFPLHDLTHYAVETVLGHRRGFFGLVIEGWSITDFGSPWPRGRMPEDSDPTELIVGFLDSERASGKTWSADDLNSELMLHGAGAVRHVSQEALDRIRALRDEFFARWRDLPEGEVLELEFARPERPPFSGT